MIANISPSSKHYQDTFNTLNFASKSRQIINKPVVNAVDGAYSMLTTLDNVAHSLETDETTRKALLEEYLELKKRMSAEAKENRDPNRRGSGTRTAAGPKLDIKDLDAYIQEKTKEAIEQRLRYMLGGEEAVKSKVDTDVFQLLKDMQNRLIEDHKRYMEQCLDEDEEEAAAGMDQETEANDHQDGKVRPWTGQPPSIAILTPSSTYHREWLSCLHHSRKLPRGSIWRAEPRSTPSADNTTGPSVTTTGVRALRMVTRASLNSSACCVQCCRSCLKRGP